MTPRADRSATVLVPDAAPAPPTPGAFVAEGNGNENENGGAEPDAGGASTARTQADNDGLRAATVKGAVWSYVSFGSARLLALVTTVALTRLIAPSDFGVIALALVTLSYLDALNEFGISSAIVYSDEDDGRDLSTTFWLSLATGCLAALLLSALAVPLAAGFHQPSLRAVVPVLSLAFVFNSIGSVHTAVLRKQLKFRRLVPVDLARSGLKTVVAISLAFAGWGVWSLVVGQLAGELAGSAAAWIILRWRPTFSWDWDVVRRVLSYGSRIMGVGFLAVILADVDYFIVGRSLGATQLGFYSVGFRLPELAVLGVCYAVSGTMFPVLTKLKGDQQSMALGLAKSLRALALITVPIGLGIALTSRDFVTAFYGDRWAPTGRVMPFIAMYAVVFSITFVCGDVYKAVGRPGILTTMAAARLPLAIVTLLLVVRHGIVWVAAAQLALMTANMLVQMTVAHRVLDVPFLFFARSTRSAFISGAAMAAVVLAAHGVIAGFDTPVRLLITSALGAVTYIAVASLLERSMIVEVTGALRSRARAA